MLNIEIDNGSGFCFGVTTAIQKAEEELAKGNRLYCLGDIVHNGMECERLRAMGLITINHDDLRELHDVIPWKPVTNSLKDNGAIRISSPRPRNSVITSVDRNLELLPVT